MSAGPKEGTVSGGSAHQSRGTSLLREEPKPFYQLTEGALDATIGSLQAGVRQLGIEAALPVIEGWEQRLAASGSPDLMPVAENLGALRTLLSAGDFDPATVGQLLATLGEQVQRVANDKDVEIEVADKLSQLSVLLSSEGDSLSGP